MQNGTVSAILAGTANLTKTTNGTVTLSGINTYSGRTVINGGNLSISNVGALGSTSGVSMADGAALLYTGGAGTLGANITITSGTGTLRNSGGGMLNLSGTLTKSGTTLAFGQGAFNVTGSIVGSNANSDLIVDSATVLLNGANTYNGPTYIRNGGSLTANVTNALPTANGRSVLVLDDSGSGSSVLVLGASQSVASLAGAASSNVTLGANTLTIGNASGNTTYSGGISGSGNLLKDGASTQVLTGDNTGFTGTTTIASGTLQAAAAGAMGNTTVVNVNGGSFLVTAENAVNDNTAITLTGGTLAVSGAFNENVGLLTLSANSVIDLDGFTGVLRFSGVGSWATGANLAIWNWNGTPKYNANNDPYSGGTRHVVFASNIGLDQYLDRISFYSGSNSGFVGNAFENSFSEPGFSGTEIIAVPETETYFYAVALLVGIVVQYLRRRAKRKTSVSCVTPWADMSKFPA
jgi:autotransporter-associated beta strand protein